MKSWGFVAIILSYQIDILTLYKHEHQIPQKERILNKEKGKEKEKV